MGLGGCRLYLAGPASAQVPAQGGLLFSVNSVGVNLCSGFLFVFFGESQAVGLEDAEHLINLGVERVCQAVRGERV